MIIDCGKADQRLVFCEDFKTRDSIQSHGGAIVGCVVNSGDSSQKSLLLNGNFETAGSPPANWTNNNASGSQVVGTRVGGVSTAGRVTYSVAAAGSIYQTQLTSGAVYKFSGWMRSDGIAVPKFGTGNAFLFTGVASTTWQYFEVIASVTHTQVHCYATGMSAGSWCEFSEISVNITNNVLPDSNMELSGVSSWTVYNGATLSKETTSPYSGTQCLRLSQNGVQSGAYQSLILNPVSKVFRITGRARSDGTAVPAIGDGGVVDRHWIGTNSTSWQTIDVTVISSNTSFFLIKRTAGTWVEFDDLQVTPIVGNGLSPTAVSSRITFSGTENIGNYTSKFTLIVKFRMGTIGATPWAVVSKCKVPFTDNHWLFLIDTTKQYRFYVCSTGASLADYKTSNDALITGQEYAIAVVFDGSLAAASRLTLYKNGVVDAGTNTGTISTQMRASSVPVVILNYADYNAQAPTNDFQLKSVRIYDVALTASEISEDYNNQIYSDIYGGG